MEKVARIERDTPIEGDQVDSSYYPIPWSEVPRGARSSGNQTGRSHTNGSSRNGNANGQMINDNGRGDAAHVEGLKEHSRFYPHHYFDWIAGTSTGG